MSKTPWRVLLVVLLVGGITAAFAAGVYVGVTNQPAIDQITGLSDKETHKPDTVDFSPFWKTWQIIDEKFVNGNSTSTATTTETDLNQERVWGAIAGLVASLDDPYSVFMPPVETKNFEQEIKGNFGGIGIEVGIRDGLLTVISPLPETPAKQAGIESGDVIVAIDSQPSAKLAIDQAVNLIRGEVGSKVTLTIARQGENKTLDLVITRAIINIPTIETELLPGRVFVIRLFNFSASSADLFRQALRQFSQAGSNKLILDLRGNPGGYLDSAVHIASWFLPAGEVVAIESRGEGQESHLYKSHGYNVFNDNLKMVILVDRGSASASEILAGALSEHGRATLVGEKTFGKGSVQELIPVTENTKLKITIARWLTPKGISISHEGLTPTVEVVKPSAEEAEETTGGEVKARDLFMEKALEILHAN